jgi:hypothetical protein
MEVLVTGLGDRELRVHVGFSGSAEEILRMLLHGSVSAFNGDCSKCGDCGKCADCGKCGDCGKCLPCGTAGRLGDAVNPPPDETQAGRLLGAGPKAGRRG